MLDFKFTIPYFAGDANNLFNLLKTALKAKTGTNRRYSFNNIFGCGFGVSKDIEDGLQATYVEINPNISFRLKRIPKETNSSFTLFYVLSNKAPQFNFDTTDKNTNDFNFSGGLLLSSKVKGYFNVYSKQKLKITGITFTKEWAEKSMNLDDSAKIFKLIRESDQPFSFFEMKDLKLENIFSEFSELFDEHETESTFFIKSKVYEFIGWFIEQSKKDNNKLNKLIGASKDQKILKIKRILKNKVLEPCPSLKELAAEIAISESVLKREFKKNEGTGVYSYHLNLKIEYSKKLLKNLDVSIGEVAHLMGYSNASKFSEAFHKRTKQTPVDWRKNKSEK